MSPSSEYKTQPSQVNGSGATVGGDKWSTPGSAAYDFRSDVVTRPTSAMLAAIGQATLLDDVFKEDSTTNDLQNYVASLTGHEAALFVTSGTMGNQLCIRTHLTQPPHSVLADASSHIMGWEAGGLASLSGAFAIPVRPANGHHLTLKDIKANAVVSDDIHACPTRLIALENTLAGTILPLEDCKEISRWARSQSPPIVMHLDGARLWEAVAANAGSLKDYCDCFDSISLCLSKGLGAPIGSIIVGSTAFIQRARWIRKPLGGGLRQSGVLTAPARVAIDETFFGGKLSASHVRAEEIAKSWESKGGKLQYACETNMVWFDLKAAGLSVERFVQLGNEHDVRVRGGRLVVHYQISDDAVKRLERLMDAALGDAKHSTSSNGIKEKAAHIIALEVE